MGNSQESSSYAFTQCFGLVSTVQFFKYILHTKSFEYRVTKTTDGKLKEVIEGETAKTSSKDIRSPIWSWILDHYITGSYFIISSLHDRYK